MTTVTIIKTESGAYREFYCMGHAGSRRFFFEKDMVCSAVSVLVINTINSLETLAKETLTVTQNEADGFIRCEFPSGLSGQGTLLLDSMILGLRGIEKQYGKKYLQVNMKEV